MINMMIYAYGLTSFLPDHDIWWQYIFLLQTIIFTLNFLNYSIASSNLSKVLFLLQFIQYIEILKSENKPFFTDYMVL